MLQQNEIFRILLFSRRTKIRRIQRDIRLSGKFLSFHKVMIEEQQFLFYINFIELSIIHFVIFLLLCSRIIQ